MTDDEILTLVREMHMLNMKYYGGPITASEFQRMQTLQKTLARYDVIGVLLKRIDNSLEMIGNRWDDFPEQSV